MLYIKEFIVEMEGSEFPGILVARGSMLNDEFVCENWDFSFEDLMPDNLDEAHRAIEEDVLNEITEEDSISKILTGEGTSAALEDWLIEFIGRSRKL